MKPYALSVFVLANLALMVSFPSSSQAQLSSKKLLPPPPALKVPQGLPSTVYNPTDVHSPLPVPPGSNSFPTQTKSKVIREYVFTSGSLPQSVPKPKTTKTKKIAVRAVKPPVNCTVIKSTVNRTAVRTVLPSIKPSVAGNFNSPEKLINPPVVATGMLYRVQVKENNKSSLTQVKNVEPLAFVRQTDGFIHAGTFSEKSQAEQRVQALATQGVKGEVIAIANTGTNPDNMANLRFSRQ